MGKNWILLIIPIYAKASIDFFCDFCFDLQNLMYYYQGLGIYKTTTENES
ncbi:hypothetical protein [uncultured Gammaproteobacteria bacterium]|nr:hypothetical protein [uncultured Gammaproteobacteria bacterium]SSC08267.1 hypothetical protein BTURTLESOX_1871 [bacterium endosymbiont of Bathymodiolus sp. 5 South]